MSITRRGFFTLSLCGLSFAAGRAVGQPGGTAARYDAAATALRAGRWAMVIDTRLLGPPLVRDMAKACHSIHNVPEITGNNEIKWIWEGSFAQAFPDADASGLPDDIKQRGFPLLCNHCANAPCVRVCPTGATFKTGQGLVSMDYHRCIGCRYCMAACPYGSRSFNFQAPRPHLAGLNPLYPTRAAGVVEKCNFCEELLNKGSLPACVQASGGAVLFGDLTDPGSVVSKALHENLNLRRKPHLGTEPAVYYLV